MKAIKNNEQAFVVGIPAGLPSGAVKAGIRRREYVDYRFVNPTHDDAGKVGGRFISLLNHPNFKAEEKLEEWTDMRPDWQREGGNLTLSMVMFRDIAEQDATPIPKLFEDFNPKVVVTRLEELTLAYPQSGETYDSITNAFKEFLAKEEVNPAGWRSGRQGVRLNYKEKLLELSLCREIN